MRSPELYLNDILESISYIQDFSKKMRFKRYLKNRLVQDAILRNLTTIGEAIKHIPLEMKNEHPNFPWKEAVALRNIIVHAYFGTDQKIIWDIVQHELPILKTAIESLQKNTPSRKK